MVTTATYLMLWVKKACSSHQLLLFFFFLLAYWELRVSKIFFLMETVMGISSSTANSCTCRWWRIGLSAEIVTYLLPLMISVKSVKGAIAALIPSKISRSCHIGTRWAMSLSLLSTHRITLLFFNTCAIVLCVDPQQVEPFLQHKNCT